MAKFSIINKLKEKRKVLIAKERNWELTHKASGNNSTSYFGDVTDDQNPFLCSFDNIKEDTWINIKLLDNEPYAIKHHVLNKFIRNKKVKLYTRENKHIWEECVHGVDIHYEVFDGKLKESIILKSLRAPFSFRFSLKLDTGSKLHKNIDGGIDVLKGDKRVFEIERPTALDKKGNLYYYNYEFEQVGKHYILTLEPVDATQLRYANYPIVIDPTLTTIYTGTTINLPGLNADSKISFSTPKNTQVAFFQDGTDIYITESQANFSDWEAYDTGLDSTANNYSGGVDSNGDIYVTYYANNFLCSSSSNDGFEAVNSISTSINGIYGTSLVIDGIDRLHTTWSAPLFSPGNVTGSIYYGTSSDAGVTWAIETITTYNLADEDFGGRYPVIAADSTDTVCIAWQRFRDPFNEWNISRAISSGSWAIDFVTTESTGSPQVEPAVGFDEDDDEYVFWAGKTNDTCYNIRYVREIGITTIGEVTADTNVAKQNRQPSVTFIVDSDKVGFCWSRSDDASTQDIRKGFYDGSANTIDTSITEYAVNSTVPLELSMPDRIEGDEGFEPFYLRRTNTFRVHHITGAATAWNVADTIITDTDTIGTFDTKNPVILSGITISSTPVSTDTASTLTVSWTEANPDTNVFAVKINAGAYNDTSGTTGTTTPGLTRCEFASAVDGNDFVDIRCVHIDDYGNTTTSTDTNIYIVPTAPDAPTLANATDSTMDVVVNNNATDSTSINPDVFDHAIHIAGGATDSWVQGDGTLGNTEVWSTVAEWGTKTITTLTKSVNYTVYSKVRNPSDNITESAIGSTAQLATTSLPPAISSTAIAVPTDGSEIYTITYDASDPDDVFVVATLFYHDSSTYVTLTTMQGDFGSVDVTTTAATKTVTWSAGVDADDVDLQTSHIKVTIDDGDTSVSDTSANFILDTKNPAFPGGTTLALSSVEDVQLVATWNNTVVETNFDTYELYISSNSLEEAQAKGGTLWDDSDDATLGTKATVTTTITGLIANTTYYIALFGKDDQGNYSTEDITASDTTEYSRRIFGYVLDDKGNYIPDANVRRYNRSSGALITSTTTDTVGFYNFAFFGSLTYQIVAHKNNYSSDVLNSLSGTIVGESVGEIYNLALNGTEDKLRPIDRADVWIGRGNSIIELNVIVAHEETNLGYGHEDISVTIDID